VTEDGKYNDGNSTGHMWNVKRSMQTNGKHGSGIRRLLKQ